MKKLIVAAAVLMILAACALGFAGASAKKNGGEYENAIMVLADAAARSGWLA